MSNKFTIEKNYNITIIAEGLDVNKAEVDFCLLLKDFKLSIPLKNIKENVFRLRLPNKIKDTIKGNKEIDYIINVKEDTLIFEVAREKFELELLTVKEVRISEEIEDESPKEIVIENNVVKITEAEPSAPSPTPAKKKPVIKEEKQPLTKELQVKQLILDIVNKNKRLE